MKRSTFNKVIMAILMVLGSPIIATVGAYYGIWQAINWVISYYKNYSIEADKKYGVEEIHFKY